MDCFYERAFYYWRHGLYGHVKIVCEQLLSDKGPDMIAYLYIALVNGLEGRIDDALLSLEPLEGREDLQLLYSFAKYLIYKISKSKTEKELMSFLNKIRLLNESATSYAIRVCGQIALMFNEYDLSMYFLSQVFDDGTPTPFYGWLLLLQEKIPEAEDFFMQFMKSPANSSNLTALMGVASLQYARSQLTACLQTLAKIQSRFMFPEVSIEKARIYFSLGKPELAYGSVKSLSCPTNFEILLVAALHSLLCCPDREDTVEKLMQVVELCLKYEPNNISLQTLIAFSFSSGSCFDKKIVRAVMPLADAAIRDGTASWRDVAIHEIIGFYLPGFTPDDSLKINDCPFTLEASLLRIMRRDGISCARDATSLLKPTSFSIKAMQIITHEPSYEALLELLNMKKDSFPLYTQEITGENFLACVATNRPDLYSHVLYNICFHNVYPLIPSQAEAILQLTKDLIMSYINLPVFRSIYSCLLYYMREYHSCLTNLECMFLSEWEPTKESYFLASSVCLKLGKIQEAREYFNFCDACPEKQVLEIEIESASQNSRRIFSLFDNLQLPLPFKYTLRLAEAAISFGQFSIARKILASGAFQVKTTLHKALMLYSSSVCSSTPESQRKHLSILETLSQDTELFPICSAAIARALALSGIDPLSSEIVRRALDDHECSEYIGDSLVQPDPLVTYAYTQNSIPRVCLKLAWSYTSRHLISDAVSSLSDLSNRCLPEYFLAAASVLFQLKKYDLAKKVLAKIPPCPDFMSARFVGFRGAIYYEEKDYETSIELIVEAITLYSTYIRPRLIKRNPTANIIKCEIANLSCTLGKAQEKLQNISGAISAFKQSLEYNPRNTKALENLKRLFPNEALTYAMSIYKEDPYNYPAVAILTDNDRGQRTESIKALKSMLDRKPTDTRLLVKLAETATKAGRPLEAKPPLEKAESILKHVHGLSEKKAGLYVAQAIFFWSTGRPKKAVQYLQLSLSSPKWRETGVSLLISCLTNPMKRLFWMESSPLCDEKSIQEAYSYLKLIPNRPLYEAAILTSQNTLESVKRAMEIYTAEEMHNSIIACQVRLGIPTNSSLLTLSTAESYLLKAAIDNSSPLPYVLLALEADRSLPVAWELCGRAHSNLGSHTDAASAFYKCWELSCFKDFSIGKRAMEEMFEAGKFEDAIEIGRALKIDNPGDATLDQKIRMSFQKLL